MEGTPIDKLAIKNARQNALQMLLQNRRGRRLTNNVETRDELDGVEPFEDGVIEGGKSASEIEQIIAAGYRGLEAGQTVDEVDDLIPIVDQEDLLGQSFAILSVRVQPKYINVGDGRPPILDYEMVMVAGQAVRVERAAEDAPYTVTESGSLFVFVAGRIDSVLGREMLALGSKASPDRPVLISSGLYRRDLGGGQYYYTTRPPRDASQRVNLFPRRAQNAKRK